MRILNLTQDTAIAKHATIADSFFSHLVGLLNRSSLSDGEALIITQCKSIHMFFMRFAIDAIFVDKQNHVVGLVRNIKPFRMSPVFLKASFVIELPVGTIEKSNTSLGDLMKVVVST